MNSFLLDLDDKNNQKEFRKYWCHLCKKDFSQIFNESSDIECIFCGKTFCELIDKEDENHPRNFQPFNVKDNQNNNINSDENLGDLLLNLINNTSSNTRFLAHVIAGSLNAYNNIYQNIDLISEDENLDDILSEIMRMDNNNYGNPPASKKAIDNLSKIEINEEIMKKFLNEKKNSCAVCKDEFKIGEICLLMPCKHNFHGGCLMPWLNKRNSCPVCRYELQTDDKEFENKKREKIINKSGNNNNLKNN